MANLLIEITELVEAFVDRAPELKNNSGVNVGLGDFNFGSFVFEY